jgi:putative salt-induced outer membrane protein YdiY
MSISISNIAPLSIALTTCLLASGQVLAAPPEEDVPKGTTTQDPATSGTTELGNQGTFTTAKEIEAAPEDPKANDATEFDISLGGIFMTGNSRALAFTGVSNFRLRRNIHQFGAAVAGNYGATGVPDSRRYESTVGNVQGLVRYDVFFAKRWSAFTQVTARHDTFQGLDYRMNVDPGVAFYALNKPTHRLWFEAGYDFQYDLRTEEALVLRDADGVPVLDIDGNTQRDPALDKVFVNHAVRLFAGYSNKLSERVSFDTSLEYLQSVIDPKVIRLIYLAGLNTQVVENFSLAVTFALRYENTPLPTVQKLDTVTALSLAYRFF